MTSTFPFLFHLPPPSPPAQLFRPYFAVTILWVSRSLRHLQFLGKLFSWVSSKRLRDSTGNKYRKNDYSKGEVNVVKIIQRKATKKEEECSYAKCLFFG